jgi:hypothetical protein
MNHVRNDRRNNELYPNDQFPIFTSAFAPRNCLDEAKDRSLQWFDSPQMIQLTDHTSVLW